MKRKLPYEPYDWLCLAFGVISLAIVIYFYFHFQIHIKGFNQFFGEIKPIFLVLDAAVFLCYFFGVKAVKAADAKNNQSAKYNRVAIFIGFVLGVYPLLIALFSFLFFPAGGF